MENTKRKFLDAIRGFSLSGGVLVALSGGADSVCLLDLFLESDFEYPIMAAHLNHNLRGEEAKRDEEFCKAFCKARGVKLFVGSADVNALAKASGKGVEEAARGARYEFLESVIKENPALSHIATAHNRTDMCETMLLNLARGASLDGLCSIPEKRGNIIRPILTLDREEIVEYNKARNLDFVTDSTNFDVKYSRNRVRLNILPEFEKLYKGYSLSFERTAALLRRDADYLADEAKRLYEEVVQDGVLDTKKAQNIHISVLSRIIKKLYNYYGFFDFAESHIDAVCEKIASGDENFTISLHRSFAICERGKLHFAKTVEKCAEFCFSVEIGEAITLPSGVTVCIANEKSDGAYPLKKDALCGGLSLRSRLDGDTVTIFKKTHKIKRIISDKKLSAKEKAKLFFLCANGEIIYSNIPAVADKAFCRRGDEAVYITVKEKDNG